MIAQSSRGIQELSPATTPQDCVPNYRWTQDSKLVRGCRRITQSSPRELLKDIGFAEEVTS